jgi:hypothetical protein
VKAGLVAACKDWDKSIASDPLSLRVQFNKRSSLNLVARCAADSIQALQSTDLFLKYEETPEFLEMMDRTTSAQSNPSNPSQEVSDFEDMTDEQLQGYWCQTHNFRTEADTEATRLEDLQHINEKMAERIKKLEQKVDEVSSDTKKSLSWLDKCCEVSFDLFILSAFSFDPQSS